MKSKKLVSMLLSLSFTAGCLSMPVFADVKTGETDAEYVVSDESSLAQAQTAYLDENGAVITYSDPVTGKIPDVEEGG